MLEITDFIVKHIVSEPGDFTRYDYLIARDCDDFMIIPYESKFDFPQRINYFDISDIETLDQCIDLTNTIPKYKHVNANTLLECITTIKKLYDDENDLCIS